MSPDDPYAEPVAQANAEQSHHVATAFLLLDQLLAVLAMRLQVRLRAIVPGLRGGRYLREVQGAIRSVMSGLGGSVGDVVEPGMAQSTQVAISREAALLELLTQRRHQDLAPDKALAVAALAGRPRPAVDPEQIAAEQAARTYDDGKTLRDRLADMERLAVEMLTSAAVQAIGDGAKASALGEQLGDLLTAAGIDNPRYRSRRIALTELSATFRAAHVAAVTDERGELLPYLRAIGWRLSWAHDVPCICDILASQDTGLGPGNYRPGDLPESHPNCRCYTVSLIVGLPFEFVRTRPRPEMVRPSERAYYGL